MSDAIGDRMKDFYEDRTRYKLPRRTYIIIRIDGKAFHTYTRGLAEPFDVPFMTDMEVTARMLCESIQGAKFAFVQSDEISIVLTDFDTINTSAWFDGNIQKIASVSASMATAYFNGARAVRKLTIEEGPNSIEELMIMKFALFDARVFSIPERTEVINYLIWRQQDATRNSIQSAAQSVYSHKQLEGKNSNQLQEMLFQKGINWNDYPVYWKRGRAILKAENNKQVFHIREPKGWRIDHIVPIFSQDRGYFDNIIPYNQDTVINCHEPATA